MTRRMISFTLVALAVLSAPWISASAAFQTSLATVEGRVVGPDRKPVDRAIVRILDEGGFREAGRAQTDQSGRFRVELPPGRYVIEVDPIATPNLAKQRKEIEIFQGPGLATGERVNVGFQLKPLATAAPPPDSHFDQEVPAQAKAEYDRALKAFDTNREEALEALRKALQAFPEYYDALELLGVEYVKDNYLDYALVVLQKAVEVNPKGQRAHYGLGVAYYKKARFDLAIQEFQRALEISSGDANATLYLGLSQFRAGNFKEAEPALKRAHDLGATGVLEQHLALAKIYGDSNRNREAANELKMLLKEKPDLKEAPKIRELIQRYESKQ